jgi:type II secretory pathway pseudopilin PulG
VVDIMKKNLIGLTLIETMLVLSIAAFLILLGMRQYQQYRIDASFVQVKKNVDVLFQALGQYYQANCRNVSDEAISSLTGKPATSTKGDLAPGGNLNVDYTLTNKAYLIDIQQMVQNHYLPPNWQTITPIVDTDSYVANFIFMLGTKQMYACWNYYTTSSTVQCNTALYFPSSTDVGPTDIQPDQVAFWLVQVSAHVYNDTDGSKTLAYLGPTGANCASGSPDTCDGSTTPSYLIWQQLPTKSGSKINSDLWVSQQQEAMFNQQYTHDVMYEFANPNYAPTGSNIDYYYLCGN